MQQNEELIDAQEALKESEEKYRTIVETANEGTWVTNTETLTIYVNKRMSEMLGYSPEEMIGKSYNDFIDDEGRALVRLKLERRRQGLKESYEHKLIRKDGSSLWVISNVTPLKDKDGKFAGSLGMLTDITERKKAEEARSLLASIVDSAEEAIIGKTLDGIIISWNAGAEKIYGYSADEVIGRPISILIPPDYIDEMPQILKRIRQGERVDRYETARLRKDGRQIYVSLTVSPIINEHGTVVGASTIAADITERKLAEEALRVSEALLSTITDNTPDPVFAKDRESRIIFANPAVIQMIGKPREAIVGKCDREFYEDPEIGEAIMANDRRIMESGQTKVIEEVGQTPDGYRTYLSTKTPYRNDNGEIIGIIGLARDITERKEAEEVLRENEARRKVAEAIEAERQRLFDVLETLPAMVCLLTPDYHVAFANRSFREKFGESNGRHCYEYCFGLTEPCEFCESYNVLKTGQPHHWEVTGPNGSVIDAYDFPFTDVDGSPMILEMDIDITERKRIEAALQMAGTYNRSLIEASLDPLVTIGPDGRITDVNAATEAVTGYGREELIDTDFLDYFTEPDKARAGYQQVFKEGLVRDYALGIRHRDGHIVPVLYNASVYRDDAGQVIGVFAAARDVTVQKQASQYARSLIESSLDPLVTISADGKITDVNEATVKVTGIFREQLIGTDFSDYFTEPEKAREGYQQVFAKGFVTDYPLTIRHTDGKLTDVLYNASIYKDTHENIIGVFAAARDITERKRAEIELDKYRKHLEDLVRERTSELEAANTKLHAEIIERKKAEEQLRKARDELELRVKERTAELSEAKEELEVINEELQVELEHHKKLEADLITAKEETEVANEELRVELDEHQKLEAELIKAKEIAEAAVEAKAAFLANMSHELRTPLNAVIGYSSLLLDDSLTPDQKVYVEGVRNGGEVLLALISDILEFSRAEKEKVTLELQPLSIKRCIEESLDMVIVQAEQKGLNIAYTINYGTPDTIIGDPGRIRQILVNLLSNAVKFTDVGDISVSASSKAVEGNKRQIAFTVKDTGIGMPKDKMDRLFKPFTQLEYTISRKRDGAGLGLAICKRLVELMGGEIWAESEEGRGSTFRFTIQAEAILGKQLDFREMIRDHAYENLAGLKPMSILVAEDNPSNQKVLVDMLKRLGYRADAVADGKEVLQVLGIRPYDLVLMDVRMPEMDGITATREIRKLWPNNGPKVVAITAYALEGDREKCLEAGMNGYIAKPVKVSELTDVLRRCQPSQDNP